MSNVPQNTAGKHRVDDEGDKCGAPPRQGQAAGWILTAAVLVFVAGLCVNSSRANDLLWQLQTGRLILLQHHAPAGDIYSWTRPGVPWVAHEWLAFVVMWLTYRAGGFAGLWLLTVGMSIVTWCIYYRVVLRELGATRDGAAPLTAFIVTCFAAVMMGSFYNPRPQLVTYLFTVIVLAVALDARRRAGAGNTEEAARARRNLWWLVPLFGVWANFHAGVLIGLGLIALLVLGDGVRIAVARRSTADISASETALCKTMVCVVAAGFLATLCNPYGVREYEDFRATISNSTMVNILEEWASPNFHEPFGWIVEGFLAVTLFSVFATRLRRDPAEVIVLVLFTHEALASMRNVPLLGLVGGLLIARHFQSALIPLIYKDGIRPADALFGPSPSPLLTLCVFVALTFTSIGKISAALTTSGPSTGALTTRIGLTAINDGSFPEHACRFIEMESIPWTMHMYNSYDDGGFLIWRIPRHPVFIDSRADVYFGPHLELVKTLYDGEYGWRSAFDRLDVDLIVTPVAEPQSRLFLAAPDWALVYVDRPNLDSHPTGYANQENTFIFIRRKPEYAALIARCRRDCPVIARHELGRYALYGSLQ
ncbi:MAG: hypothetical protein ACLQVD_07155 [Capsulimonadaceae bacterium]